MTYLHRDLSPPGMAGDGGGEMVLYEQTPSGPAGFDPQAPAGEIGRVLPRAGIVGWFRRNASIGGLVDPAR